MSFLLHACGLSAAWIVVGLGVHFIPLIPCMASSLSGVASVEGLSHHLFCMPVIPCCRVGNALVGFDLAIAVFVVERVECHPLQGGRHTEGAGVRVTWPCVPGVSGLVERVDGSHGHTVHANASACPTGQWLLLAALSFSVPPWFSSPA
jgi:hypothetical protein